MPTTKLNNGQLPDTISSKTVDNTNDINTTTTRLKITGGSSGQVLSTDGSGNLSWKSDSVTDGDKGDITVSASGATWTVDNDAVTFGKMQNITTARLLGRGSAGTGDIEEIQLGSNLSLSGTTLNATSGGVTDGDKGDITVSGSGATWTIDNDAVTYAKIQNVSASRVLGRGSASGSGDVQELTTGSNLTISGTTLSVASSGITATELATDAVTTAKIQNNAVTYAKMQAMQNTTLLGRSSVLGGGAPMEIAVGSNLLLSGGTLSANLDGDKGDITVSASGATWTIDSNAVTATKIATDAVVEAKIASNAVTTAKIQNDAVTYAKIQNVTTNRLLGRVSAGSGDTEEITIGSGLSVSGTTLSVSGVPTAVVSKTADETVTSSTTFQADDSLTYTLTANRMYYIEFVLIVQRANVSATPAIKFAVDAGSYGSGDFIERTTARLWDGTTALNNVLTLDSTYNIAGRVFINGMVVPAVNQAVTLYFAQNTSSTTGVTVRKNSIMRIYDLGAV